MTKYRKKQNEVRELARDFQLSFNDAHYYMSELIEIEDKLYRLGKKYGLLKEFRENGII